jgi:hypothetical protein
MDPKCSISTCQSAFELPESLAFSVDRGYVSICASEDSAFLKSLQKVKTVALNDPHRN